MKKLLFIVALLFILGLSTETKAQAEPQISAKSAIVYDCANGKVLFAKNPNEKLPIASVTKIMSVILAIEDGKLNSKVTVSKEAANQPAKTVGLRAGDTFTLEQLLYAMMMQSGNDAAYAVAQHVGGTVDNFVKMMNQKAKELGLKNTTYHTPSGLNVPQENYSTASDLAKLMCYAMNNETFRKIVATHDYSTASGEGYSYDWLNEDKLVRDYDWIIGGKTGFTKAAGRTLVNAAEKNGVRLIAVTLNDLNDWQDQLNMFKYAYGKLGITV